MVSIGLAQASAAFLLMRLKANTANMRCRCRPAASKNSRPVRSSPLATMLRSRTPRTAPSDIGSAERRECRADEGGADRIQQEGIARGGEVDRDRCRQDEARNRRDDPGEDEGRGNMRSQGRPRNSVRRLAGCRSKARRAPNRVRERSTEAPAMMRAAIMSGTGTPAIPSVP